MTAAEALRDCETATRKAAGNFYYGILSLPAPERRAVCAVYAYCRACDDVVDDPGDAALQARELLALRALARDGRSSGRWPHLAPAVRFLRRRWGLPPELFEAVADGMSMDLRGGRYETWRDLRDYCWRAASAVGLLYLHICGRPTEAAREAAIDFGLAMQLTNILRDVPEDFRRGRVYLPLEDLRRFGVRPEELSAPAASEAVRTLARFEIARARSLFRSGARIDRFLRPRARASPRVFRAIYERVLDRIERRGGDILGPRVEIPRAVKGLLVLRSCLGPLSA